MDTDDLEPQRPNLAAAKNLEEMSVEALGEYILELEGEIARVKSAIEVKKAARGAADSFFKS